MAVNEPFDLIAYSSFMTIGIVYFLPQEIHSELSFW